MRIAIFRSSERQFVILLYASPQEAPGREGSEHIQTCSPASALQATQSKHGSGTKNPTPHLRSTAGTFLIQGGIIFNVDS